jgi:hypothetical protein
MEEIGRKKGEGFLEDWVGNTVGLQMGSGLVIEVEWWEMESGGWASFKDIDKSVRTTTLLSLEEKCAKSTITL